MAAQLLGIAEGEPAGIDVPSGQGHQVEQEDIHPPVGPVGKRITEGSVMNRLPGFGPGVDTVFQGSDDLTGDFFVDGFFLSFIVSLLECRDIPSGRHQWVSCAVVAGFGKGENLFAHDQMIEDPDVDHLEDLGQGAGEFQVFLAGLDTAGGVVMGNDDRRCVER